MAAPAPTITPDRAVANDLALPERLFRDLFRIRHVEEEVARIYPSDKIKSPVHLSIGQEAVAVGVCSALRPDDLVFGTYRSHAAYLAKGGNLRAMIAELYGKETGCGHGKGGSMHLADVAHGVMGTSAVVATTVPHAAGYAYSLQLRGSEAVVVSFFGDGATEEGVFYETLNFAALHDLPLLFVCENNGYAIHTPQRARVKLADIASRARAFGVASESLVDDDVFRLRDVTATAVERLRRGAGPYLIECPTYRWREHVGPGEDWHLGFRSRDEAVPWMERDQVALVGGALPAARRIEIEQTVRDEVADAFAFAEASPFPDAGELWTHVEVKAREAQSAEQPAVARRLGYGEAIREATAQEMAQDERVMVLGLGVNDNGRWIYGTTRELADQFGESRCFDTPLSEDAMTGVAVGAAMAGMRPIHVHIRQDFLLLCMNQLVNVAAKAHYMYGGSVSVPLVVRSVIGKSWGQGAQHSQALQSLFMHIPGLKVVAPTTPYDAKGTLIQSIRDDNPIIFIEHRLLHCQRGPVPEQPYTVPLGKARVLAPGTDITLVGISWMAVECLRARAYLAQVGISAEVIDPVTLSPLDMQTISNSVARTGHALVVDNGWTTCGASAEIVARLSEGGASVLPAQRMGFAPTTCPPTPPLENAFYPDGGSIATFVNASCLGGDPSWIPALEIHPEQLEFRGPF